MSGSDRPTSTRSTASRSLWLVVAALVVASRLLLVPGQPWEQDEALFAAASFDTDLAASRPHPPGFPLWVAAGKVGLALLGDPLVALQLLSALASLATLPLLARSWGAALDDRRLGRAAALLYALAPAVWFHAPRAFSDTPAVLFAAAACVAWLGPGRQGLLVGTLSVAAALLVRPVLAPPLLVLMAAALALRRETAAEVGRAAALLVAVVGVGFLPLVVDCGGLWPFARALVGHGAEHAGALHLAPWQPAGLGVVKAVGGIAPAVGAVLLAALWWWREVRCRPRCAWWWLAVTAATAGWLLLAHNRTYPRYSLPLLALLAGPAVGGLGAMLRSPRRACWGAALATAAGVAWTWPAMVAQATEPFPPLAALRAAMLESTSGTVVVDGGLSPFTDLLGLAAAARRPLAWRPLLAEGRVPVEAVRGPWTYVWAEGTAHALVPGPLSPARTFSCASPRLRRLAQDRYLTCWSTDRGGIVLAPETPAIRSTGEVRLDDQLELLLQPTPPGSWLGAVVDVDDAPVDLELEGGRQGTRRARLEPGRRCFHVLLDQPAVDDAGRPTVVALRRTAGSGRVLLARVWIDPPDGRFTPPWISPAEQLGGLEGLVDGGGFHDVERFGEREGRWTGASAWLSVPAGPGRLVVELIAPRPEPATVVLRAASLGSLRVLRIGAGWQEVAVPVTPAAGRVLLQLEVANPFVPAVAIPGSSDRRELGVVVGAVRFERGG